MYTKEFLPKIMFFKIDQKETKYLGNFWMNIKMSQSGHTEHRGPYF